MKIKQISLCFFRALMLILWLALAQLIAHGVLWLLENFYFALHEWFGELFPLFSPISNKEHYELWYTSLSKLASALGIFIGVYIATLTDNRRNERIISLTDGFFTVPEGVPLYIKIFALSDVLGSLVAAFAVTLPAAFIPEAFFTKDYSFPLYFSKLWVDSVGALPAVLFVFLIAMISHLPALVLSLRRWRVGWLVGFTS